MYGWVTHMWSPGKGCSHQCSYCYAKLAAERYGRDFPDTFQLDPHMPRLDGLKREGEDRVMFVGYTCDMWAKDVSDFTIYDILAHCDAFPKNKYVFQSKNPARFLHFEPLVHIYATLGTTIETNREDVLRKLSKAPPASERAWAMGDLQECFIKFVTIEPIMDLDIPDMVSLIKTASPDWVNIGADSKKQYLPEPNSYKVANLIDALRTMNIEVRIKPNLKRLLPKDWPEVIK
jgi:DNA repair photolyase